MTHEFQARPRRRHPEMLLLAGAGSRADHTFSFPSCQVRRLDSEARLSDDTASQNISLAIRCTGHGLRRNSVRQESFLNETFQVL